jgi:hypothetical protein
MALLPPPAPPPPGTGGTLRPGTAPFGRLLGLGLGAILRLVWAVPLQAGVAWLGRAVAWTPVVIAFGLARTALERGQDPLGALARAVGTPGVILPAAGLAVTLGLLAVAVQSALWAGLAGSLAGAARRHGKPPSLAAFASSLGERFPRFLALGAAVAVGALAWFGACWSLLLAGAKLYLDAAGEGRGGPVAAVALALGGALYLLGTPLLGFLVRLAAARLATGTRSALAALHEAAGQFFRRPFTLAGGALLLRFTAGFAAATVAAPSALIPPEPLVVLALALLIEAASDLVSALGLLAEWSFLVTAAVDDREGLPPLLPRPAPMTALRPGAFPPAPPPGRIP